MAFNHKMSLEKVDFWNQKLKAFKFTSVIAGDSDDDNNYSDDLVEKELEIKLDITKKSRRINRPVQFADQHGNRYHNICLLKNQFNFKDI